MREKIGRWILFILMLPFTAFISYFVLLFLVSFRLVNNVKYRDYGVFTGILKYPIFNYSSCLGRIILLHPNSGKKVLMHELVHLRQWEDVFSFSFLLGIFVFIASGQVLTALLIWLSGCLYIPLSYFVAWLRGDDFYHDSEAERSARYQVYHIED